MFDLAKRLGNKPIVHLKSIHMHVNKILALEKMSVKEFGGLLKDFLAYEEMPLMLLNNFAPPFGLFNGAICTFNGLLYVPNEISMKLNCSVLKSRKLRNLTVQQPLDLRGGNFSSRIHQLAKGSVLVRIDGLSILSDEQIKDRIDSGESLECQFRLPATPPSLPDFIIVESTAYKDRGGPNIIGFPGAEKLVPIPCKKVMREGKERGKKCGEYRVGFMVECALAVTGYKGQGITVERAKIHIKDFVNVPVFLMFLFPA